MTYPPTDLVGVQHYLHDQTGQPWDALGIIHGTPLGGGYHEGNDLLATASRLNNDYSKRESPRDRPGSDAASALDIGGEFPRFREVTLAIVAACQRGDPRTRDIRECIYTPDGRTVHRWDRLGVRQSGDDSHLTHTHISFHRDSEGRRDQPDNILGLLIELFEGDDMAISDADWARMRRLVENIEAVVTERAGQHGDVPMETIGGLDWGTGDGAKHSIRSARAELLAAVRAVQTGGVDLDALAARVAPLVTAQIGTRLDALDAKLTHVLAALAAAGHVAEA